MFFKFRKNFILFARKKIIFLAHHKILHEINLDISNCLTYQPKNKFLIVMGIHRVNSLLLHIFSGIRIGIQTEHLYDNKKNKIYINGVSPIDAIKKNLDFFEFILDFDLSNRYFYEKNGFDLNKVIFGPYIFPKFPSQFSDNNSNYFVFVGSLSNNRRQKILDNLKITNSKILILGEGSYGKALKNSLKNSCGIINIAAEKTSYIPYPRILKSIIYGKPLISEKLPNPLIENKHYLLLKDIENNELHKKTFQELVKYFKKYNFDDFLMKLDKSVLTKSC